MTETTSSARARSSSGEQIFCSFDTNSIYIALKRTEYQKNLNGDYKEKCNEKKLTSSSSC